MQQATELLGSSNGRRRRWWWWQLLIFSLLPSALPHQFATPSKALFYATGSCCIACGPALHVLWWKVHAILSQLSLPAYPGCNLCTPTQSLAGYEFDMTRIDCTIAAASPPPPDIVARTWLWSNLLELHLKRKSSFSAFVKCSAFVISLQAEKGPIALWFLQLGLSEIH